MSNQTRRWAWGIYFQQNATYPWVEASQWEIKYEFDIYALYCTKIWDQEGKNTYQKYMKQIYRDQHIAFRTHSSMLD